MGKLMAFFYAYNFQFIGSRPFSTRILFALEKCLQPKKPRCTENGEGCGAVRIKCLFVSIKLILFCANLPQRRKTIPARRSEIVLIT